MSYLVEFGLLVDGIFLIDFLVSQVLLVKIEYNVDGYCVVWRVEFYIRGVEIVNGYQELIDVVVQEVCLKVDFQFCIVYQFDELLMFVFLFGVLQYGFLECVGVVLGVDCLMMVIIIVSSIDLVLSFDWE